MKAILEFNLDESGDVEAHKRAIKSLDLALALYDINQYLRSQTKYAPDSMNPEVYKALEDVRDQFRQIMNDNNIDLDELMS